RLNRELACRKRQLPGTPPLLRTLHSNNPRVRNAHSTTFARSSLPTTDTMHPLTPAGGNRMDSKPFRYAFKDGNSPQGKIIPPSRTEPEKPLIRNLLLLPSQLNRIL